MSVIGTLKPHHVSYSVPDIERAIAFWQDIFGFELNFRFDVAAIGGQGAFLSSPALKIELWEVAGSVPVPDERRQPNTDLKTAGTKHMAFQLDDLPGALARLDQAGVSIAAVQTSPDQPMRPYAGPVERAFSAFVRDPFGSLIELLGPEA
jgi:methylmalonyl-CoA/ethylmalonyl-CoA epimerase